MFRLDTRSKILVVVGLFFFRFAVLFVPLLDTFGYFGVEIAVGVEEVEALVHINNDMEQQFDTTSSGESSRNHRHAEQLAQFCIVDIISTFLSLIEHI